MYGPFEILCIVLFVMLIIVLIITGLSIRQDEIENCEKIESLGYDSDDVYVFTKMLNLNLSDFVASKSLREQYKAFRDGDNSLIQKLIKNHNNN